MVDIGIPVGLLVLLLLLGVPVALCLAIAGTAGLLIVTGDVQIVTHFLATTPYASVSDEGLATIPGFVLMAYLASRAGFAGDAFNAARVWLSRIRGGLAISTTVASAAFGAMSGASTASAAVMSEVAHGEMAKSGYSTRLSTGTVAAGSTLSVLVPPSVGMVVYSTTTETSLRDLLIGGIVPGVILTILFSITILTWVTVRRESAPPAMRFSWRERLVVLRPVWFVGLVILILLYLLYGGIVAPSELGGVGSVVLLVLGLVKRRLTFNRITNSVGAALKTSAMIFLIIIGAHIFGYYLTLTRIPQNLVSTIGQSALPSTIVLLILCALYFVGGMFMDENPLMLITLPLTFPVVVSLGFNPVWYGILIMVLVAMGLLTPPVGLAAFIVSGTTGKPADLVYQGASVLMVPMVITFFLLLAFPTLVTWLPALSR
jgi:tripartite ATP-independent transporter DctM subunit